MNNPISISQLAELNRLHEQNCISARTTLENGQRIGELLTEFKASLAHGQWLPWLEVNTKISQRTARNYMRIYRERDRLKSATIADLTEAYEMLTDHIPSSSVADAAPVQTHSGAVPLWRLIKIPLHPICEAWPLINDVEFGLLVDSIRKCGLLQPITLYQGQILDGKLRYEACLAADVEPIFTEYTGDDPEGYSWSMNGARNHFSPEQRKEMHSKFIAYVEECGSPEEQAALKQTIAEMENALSCTSFADLQKLCPDCPTPDEMCE